MEWGVIRLLSCLCALLLGVLLSRRQAVTVSISVSPKLLSLAAKARSLRDSLLSSGAFEVPTRTVNCLHYSICTEPESDAGVSELEDAPMHGKDYSHGSVRDPGPRVVAHETAAGRALEGASETRVAFERLTWPRAQVRTRPS